ncbi:ABC transporter permease [Metabacillus malikii]|uniref:ABC-2 type transport system permease protein n=1 Tax=Metabacillus malikii TaxID=1504265 RepID=A0ABT9ZJ40_9BACI|nr:ABC transporter permease [Metabacillus malikii]MDQ0232303.1 ABC-2 type transport system permease protein [Metabacillus malikii]
MKSIDEIWKTRLNHHINETRSYLKYMLNDHLLFVFIFLAAGGAVAYSGWLKTVPSDFPAIHLMALTFALIVASSNVRTLVKEADIVFLIPMEHKLKAYFKKAFIYSFITQCFVLVVLIIVFSPLYFAVTPANGGDLLICLLFILLIKYWNLRMSWKMEFYSESSTRLVDLFVRFVVSLCTIFFAFSDEYMYSIVLIVVMFLYEVYFSKQVRARAMKWDQLIKKEDARKQSFYKIANLFTDVPKLKKRAKRRQYLDWLLKQVKYNQENIFDYLFIRAFLRSGDYSGIVMRLTIIGAVVLYVINNELIGNSLVVILLSFLTGIQIMSLYKHYDLIELPSLYPKAESRKLSSFLQIIYKVLLGQLFVYLIVILLKGHVVTTALTLGISIVFITVFVYGYMKSRLSSEKRV